MNKHLIALTLTTVLYAMPGITANPSPVSNATDGWDFNMPADQLAKLCTDTLADARHAFTRIETDTEKATLQQVYGAYDAMSIGLQKIQHVWYLKDTHPNADIRASAEKCISEYSDFAVSLDLSQAFYHRVEAIDLSTVNAAEQLMVEKKLRAFRQAGVDKDQATRDKVRQLLNDITDLGQEFGKHIREDKRFVQTTAAQLAGLPQDFLDSHPADDNGVITVSTDYPDYYPVMTYARDDDLRRRLYFEAKNIGMPANEKTLRALIKKRYELATLLGYDSWAALAMEELMIASPGNAHDFLSKMGTTASKPAEADMAILLARLRQIDPQAQHVQSWQSLYLSNLVRQDDYALDAKEVREYFKFERVQAGIFQLVEDLFGVEIVPWKTQTWHEDVTAWEIREHGKAIGRFYLDLHPRADKYRHAAHWTLRTGLKDGQLPLSGMATNFPTGVMEHSQVVTFLHEFGHLLHNMFSGTQPWLDISGMSMERDFVEAPSQMLEEWVWDYDTLRRFAINDAGQPLPKPLAGKMKRARHFGEASGTANQLFYANLSLNYYNRPADSFELLTLLKELQKKYSPYPYVEGTHFYTSFGHLNGYSSNYYIYQWSKAISTDLLSRFLSAGLRDTAVAREYREKVLAPGGSKPATQLVEDFLGRPFSTETYTTYLNQLN